MPSDDLEFANSVAMMFEMQTNDEKHETVIHSQTEDPVLCPVKSWARLTNWIWRYLALGTTEYTHGLKPCQTQTDNIKTSDHNT